MSTKPHRPSQAQGVGSVFLANAPLRICSLRSFRTSSFVSNSTGLRSNCWTHSLALNSFFDVEQAISSHRHSRRAKYALFRNPQEKRVPRDHRAIAKPIHHPLFRIEYPPLRHRSPELEASPPAWERSTCYDDCAQGDTIPPPHMI